jgi:hypothetical protein
MLRTCLVTLATMLVGCAKPSPLPTYPQMTESTAIELLASRAGLIKTVSGEGALGLTRADGQSVRLDTAIAMQPPDHVRLRAWKFAQAVFDLTVTPDGTWLVAERGQATNDVRKNDVMSAGISAGEFAKGWSLFSGAFFSDPGLIAESHGRWLIVRRENASEPTVICRVDRATLTPRQYIMQDQAGASVFTLNLDDYRQIGAMAWPYRIEATSPSGRVLVEMRDMELNGELPPKAFVPPARAERLK